MQNKKKKPFHAGSSSQAKDKAQAPKERIMPFSRMLSELEEAIEFIGRSSEIGPTVGASCRCFTVTST